MKFKKPIGITLLIMASMAMIIGSLYIAGVFNGNQTKKAQYIEGDMSNNTKEETLESSPVEKKQKDNQTENKQAEDNKAEDNKAEDNKAEDSKEEDKWKAESKVEIINNTLEYEADMTLYYDKENKAFVELTYYYDGFSQLREYSSIHIPFLKEIEGKEDRAQSLNSVIEKATLNSKLGKMYFFVKKKTSSSNEKFCLYVINLKDGKAKEIYIGEGANLGHLRFSSDKKLAAFNYEDGEDTQRPKSLLQILDCSIDKWLVAEGKTGDGKRMGQEGVPSKEYFYKILSWKSATEISLKEISYEKTTQNGNTVVSGDIELTYDTSANLIKYPEGYNSQGVKIAVQPENSNKTEGTANTKDSSALTTLKEFYGMIAKEEYNKAYDLLDDKFRLNAFKMFGAIEISKNEIDVDFFSEFAKSTGIFKSLEIEKIIKEETEGEAARIYYHQSVKLEQDKDPLEMPLVATLNKVDQKWKITALDDWEKP